LNGKLINRPYIFYKLTIQNRSENSNTMKYLLLPISLIALLLTCNTIQAETQRPPINPVPLSLNSDNFYHKYIDANGIPVIASQNVRDEALFKAYDIIVGMLGKRKDLAEYMAKVGCKVMIIGEKEETLDLPEYRWLGKTEEERIFWNKRARGFGGAPEHDLGASCGEENLLCLESDRYVGENILIHEFAHIIHLIGIAGIDPDFDKQLSILYEQAKEEGLWSNTYVMENKEEYFAETVQSFFNANRYSKEPNGVHNDINRREKLKKYDPDIYNLLLHYFPEDIDISICNIIHE